MIVLQGIILHMESLLLSRVTLLTHSKHINKRMENIYIDMELVLPIYSAHPYFSLKNWGKKVRIIHSKIWQIAVPSSPTTCRAEGMAGSMLCVTFGREYSWKPQALSHLWGAGWGAKVQAAWLPWEGEVFFPWKFSPASDG